MCSLRKCSHFKSVDKYYQRSINKNNHLDDFENVVTSNQFVKNTSLYVSKHSFSKSISKISYTWLFYKVVT